MAEANVTTISLKAKIDTKDAEKKLASLQQSLQSFQDAIKNLNVNSKSYDSLRKITDAVRGLSELKVSKATATNVGTLADNLAKLSAINVERLRPVIDTLKHLGSLGDFKVPKVKGVKNLEEAFGGEKPEMKDVPGAAGSAKVDIKELDTAVAAAKKRWDDFNAAVRKTVSTLKSVSAFAGSALGNAIVAPWRKITTSVVSATKRLAGFLSALKRIALYRAIRTALKEITQGFREGMQNLYRYSELIDGKFKESMDSLATSALYLKNSLGAMSAPIVNVLAPAVDMLVDKFVDLLNTFNELLATLTGAETWTKALKYPKEYMEETEAAAGSAKKLRATLLGFDEINRLDDNNKGSRGSAAEELDYSKMFEEKDVSTAAKNWAKKVKEAFAKADLTSIGKDIGESIKRGLNKIDWTGIENSIDNAALSFATLLNGLVDVDGLGKDIGKSIAKAINVGVNGIYKFFTTVNWKEIGKFIGDGINGFVDTFDSMRLGESFAATFNAGINALLGMVSSVKWDSLGTFIANGINGFFNEVNTQALGQTISKGIIGALKTVKSFFRDTDFAAIGTKIGEMIRDIDWGDALKELGGVLFEAIKGALEALANLILTAPEEIFEAVGTVLAAQLALGAVTEKAKTLFTASLGKLTGNAGVGALASAGSKALNVVGDVTIVGIAAVAGYKIGEALYEKVKPIRDAADKIMSFVGKICDFLGINITGTHQSHGGGTSFGEPEVTVEIIDTSGGKQNTLNAGGGHYYNPNLSKAITVKGNAGGGSVATGDLFLANEKEPELIGHIGNRTQVANNDQITESIRVATAQGNAESNMLLREAVDALQALLNKDTMVVAEVTTDSITSGLARQNRRNGRTVVPVGG